MDCPKLLMELKKEYKNCDELFKIARYLNMNENTGSQFSEKVADYTLDLMQTIGSLIEKWERQIAVEKTLYESYGLEKEYDSDYIIVGCSTCKYHHADVPHTCDICTSLDQEEEFTMWEEKE